MSNAAQAFTERTLMTAVGAKYRLLEKGSIQIFGGLIEWTENTKRGPILRSGHLDSETVLGVLLEHLPPHAPTTPTPPTTARREDTPS